MKLWHLVTVGILIHIVLLYSILDICFISTLVYGMTPVTIPIHAPAARLVLFVADGLRADKFFEPDENGRSRVPFLRKVVEEEGMWGISHTRIPTETRPGHVALLAGVYEDVSSVAKGWIESEADFDSVFNQSQYTWSWGSPDILPMFAQGASRNHVRTICYPADLEDFAASDMILLDTWVFDQVKKFIAEASNNLTLETELRQDKIVMFLHLLGVDTHGHSHKPFSREYLNNIQVIDKGIRETVKLVNDFFHNDGRTAFVMTADHGMTDWGSHGSGHPEETLTPFIAWGPGVSGPIVKDGCGEFADTYCADWHLDSLKRSDIQQGVLPVDVLNASDSVKVEALLANAQQLLAQFQVRMIETKKRVLSPLFRPFRELEEKEKLREAEKLIQLALKGLRYYQTYDRLFLGVGITMLFLGWLSWLLCLVMAEHTLLAQQVWSPPGSVWKMASLSRPPIREKHITLFGLKGSTLGYGLLVTVCTAVVVLLFAQSMPLMYYVYFLLPVLLWYKSVDNWHLLSPGIQSLLAQNGFPWRLVQCCLLCFFGLEILVHSFYRRELLSLGLLAMTVWPLVSNVANPSSKPCTFTSYGWSLSCLLVAVFPLLPVLDGTTQYSLVLGKISCILSKHILTFQLGVVATSLLTVTVTSRSISQKQGLPLLCQLTSWLTLAGSVVLPLFTGSGLGERLFSLALAFFSTFLLMSFTYEGFFMLSFLALLYFWVRMETETCGLPKQQEIFTQLNFAQPLSRAIKDHNQNSRLMQLSDLRMAFFFVSLAWLRMM
ncbi:GPI ethanolamine phosphate transferase 1 [Plakobranchus ocellatus]|uniref:GPI ethanolamine phosphate transferase 1 n=1 Tax=Plakobranchus ocellatus TaxID=259542 RepID=A0AAV4BSJ2_9GAST|nr:GPI ethanolamine phosphate transferase 1 [Plakobranchus ocellatus]